MRVILLSAACLLGLLGCETLPRRPAGAMPIFVDEVGDEHAMQREVEKHIAVGMPVQKACSVLKQHGFTYSSPKCDRPAILCEATDQAKPAGTRHARVWIYYDVKGVVTEIEAYADATPS